MHAGSFNSSIRIAVAIVALSCGRAFAGFTDAAYAGDGKPIVNEPVTDDNQKLEFNVTTQQTSHIVPHVQTLVSQPIAPVTAPLPVALLPGGALLLGSFIATKVFKRKLV
jgi:hypothetical protein